MNVGDVIIDNKSINENLVLYAKRIDGKLLPSSEAILLELAEDEHNIGTKELESIKCQGFTYCMEMFLMQEVIPLTVRLFWHYL